MSHSFKYQIRYKIGKQRNWRDVCKMADYNAAVEHAKAMRLQLAKDYKAAAPTIKMAVMEYNQLLAEV